jgi:predicted DCC family thiol-disulfide oxidoreductase YuxK
LLRHEYGNTLQFASSRKPIGIQLAQEHGIAPDTLDLTYLVIRHGQALTKSDASLGLTGELKAPWRYLAVLQFVPRSLRDWIYDIVARNRLSWFGEQKDCFLPTPVQRLKFLDDLPSHGESPKRAE